MEFAKTKEKKKKIKRKHHIWEDSSTATEPMVSP